MFYFKFFDTESKLVNKDSKIQKFPSNLKIDPNNEDLSYVALKGTTIKRKTMMEPQLEYIPREFANNELPIKLRSEEDSSSPSSEEEIPMPVKDTQKTSNMPTVQHSLDRQLNQDSSTIFI